MKNVCKDPAEFTHHAQTIGDAERDRTIYDVRAGVLSNARGAHVGIEASW